MIDYRLAETESKFADLIWENEPINSTELVRLSEEVMKWKKNLHIHHPEAVVRQGDFQKRGRSRYVAISRDEFYAGQSRCYIEDTFGGSLPRFLTSFIGGKRLSNKQAEELVRLINEHKGD